MARYIVKASSAVFAILILTALSGCLRKPRLDLSGLDANPPGSGAGVAGTTFEPLPTNPLGGTGDAAGWGSTDGPLAGGAGSSIVPTDKRWAKVVVYFAYDSAAIGPAEKPKLDTLCQHLQEYPEYAVVVEGHCDERGSDEYNRALGETRALVVRDYLCSKSIAPERIETVSYGEERPVVPNATTEAEHSQNRRAEFVIGVRR